MRSIFVFLPLAALSACASSSTSSNATSTDVFTTDLVIPDVNSVPGPVADVVAAYLDDNAAFAPTQDLQMGEATYAGQFAFGFSGDNDSTVAGDMRLAMNFDEASLTGALENIVVYDGNGVGEDTAGHVLAVTGDAAGNTIHADIKGHFHVGDDTWVVDAHTHGALGGPNGEIAIGDIDGIVEYSPTESEGI
ncbi:MAG: hypothetical protein AAGK01_14320, partial [Pseudomonadota bacterium]